MYTYMCIYHYIYIYINIYVYIYIHTYIYVFITEVCRHTPCTCKSASSACLVGWCNDNLRKYFLTPYTPLRIHILTTYTPHTPADQHHWRAFFCGAATVFVYLFSHPTYPLVYIFLQPTHPTHLRISIVSVPFFVVRRQSSYIYFHTHWYTYSYNLHTPRTCKSALSAFLVACGAATVFVYIFSHLTHPFACTLS